MQITLNSLNNSMASSRPSQNNADVHKILTIRAEQASRNEEPCFRTKDSHDCAQMCEWRRDCRKLKAVWRR